jgi:hypothetical protein
MPVKINGATSGSVTLTAPATGTDVTLTLPATGFGKILQVVSTTKTDTASISIGTGAESADISGLTATITPSSTNSKILVFGQVSVGCEVSVLAFFLTLFRASSVVTGATGDASGNRSRVTTAGFIEALAYSSTVPILYLDSPATTSATTYSLRMRHQSGSTKVMYVNRDGEDGNLAIYGRSISTLTLMEVSA